MIFSLFRQLYLSTVCFAILGTKTLIGQSKKIEKIDPKMKQMC